MECIEMYRRILFVGVLPLMASQSDRRAALGILFSLCSLAFYGEMSPFVSAPTNILAYVAQYASLLTYGAALAIAVGLDQGIDPLLFGCLLVMFNTSIVGLVFRASLLRYFHERSLQQCRQQLSSQEKQIVSCVMLSEPLSSSLSSTFAEGVEGVELVDRNVDNKRSSEFESRSRRALLQSLIDSNDVKMSKRVGAGAFGEVK
jgi:hypothetical protein